MPYAGCGCARLVRLHPPSLPALLSRVDGRVVVRVVRAEEGGTGDHVGADDVAPPALAGGTGTSAYCTAEAAAAAASCGGGGVFARDEAKEEYSLMMQPASKWRGQRKQRGGT
jgi:hypothetical protein